MKIKFVRAAVLAAVAVLALSAAGCGGDNTTSTSANDQAGKNASGARLTVKDSKLGPIVTDASGKTLYLFTADKDGKSSCSGVCSGAWQPVTVVGKVDAGTGIDQGDISTFKRSDGAVQLVYHDHPLYYYAGDRTRSSTTGNGLSAFGGEWYAVKANGDATD